MQFFEFTDLPLLFIILESCHYNFTNLRTIPLHTFSLCFLNFMDKNTPDLLLPLTPPSFLSLSTATNSSAEHHLGASAARATGRLRAFAGRLGVATPSSPAAIPTTNGEGEEGRWWREERGGGGGAPAPPRGPPPARGGSRRAAMGGRLGGERGRGRREAALSRPPQGSAPLLAGHREPGRRSCARPPPAELELVPTRRRLPAATSPERRGGR